MKAALDNTTKPTPVGNTTAPAGANAPVNSGQIKEAIKAADDATKE